MQYLYLGVITENNNKTYVATKHIETYYSVTQKNSGHHVNMH